MGERKGKRSEGGYEVGEWQLEDVGWTQDWQGSGRLSTLAHTVSEEQS